MVTPCMLHFYRLLRQPMYYACSTYVYVQTRIVSLSKSDLKIYRFTGHTSTLLSSLAVNRSADIILTYPCTEWEQEKLSRTCCAGRSPS